MSAHTPGEWAVSEKGSVSTGIFADKFELATCYVRDWNPSSQEEAKANARLIAAAPDLLAALQLVVDTYGFDSSTDSAIWQTANAALKKATQ